MAAGRCTYVTRHRVAAPGWDGEAVKVEIDSDACARLYFDFVRPGTKLLFFGVE
jgi:hypothetical protein